MDLMLLHHESPLLWPLNIYLSLTLMLQVTQVREHESQRLYNQTTGVIRMPLRNIIDATITPTENTK